ncbi:hypothetical protein SLA2020_409930 [Shorea laevis]
MPEWLAVTPRAKLHFQDEMRVNAGYEQTHGAAREPAAYDIHYFPAEFRVLMSSSGRICRAFNSEGIWRCRDDLEGSRRRGWSQRWSERWSAEAREEAIGEERKMEWIRDLRRGLEDLRFRFAA